MNNYVTLGFLPRAGSTKLAKFLSTDPQLCVVPNSASDFYVEKMEVGFEDCFVNEVTLYSALNNFIVGLSGAEKNQTIIDKNRNWFVRSKMLKSINSTRKHILIVRDIRYCIASWENIFRNNNTHRAYDKCFPALFEKLTLTQRIDTYLNENNQNLGYWVNHLSEILMYEPTRLSDEDILIVRFEDLMSDFKSEIERIYEFIGLENKSLTVEPYSKELEKDSFDHFKSPIHKVENIEFLNKQENLADYFSPQVSEYIIGKYKVYYDTFYPQVLTGETV